MPKKWDPPKRWTEKALDTLTYDQILTLDRKEMIRLANAYQRNFRRRVRSFGGRYSFAEQALRDSFKSEKVEVQVPKKDGSGFVTKTKTVGPKFKLFSHINNKTVTSGTLNNDLRSYLSKMQHFFNPQGASVTGIHTNTLAGIEANHRRLEAYVFGTDADGNPLAHASEAEMKQIMDLYKAYYHDHAVEGKGVVEYQSVFTALSYMYQTGNLGQGKITDYANLQDVMKKVNSGEIDLQDVDIWAPNAKDQMAQLLDPIFIITPEELDGVEVVNLHDDYPL